MLGKILILAATINSLFAHTPLKVVASFTVIKDFVERIGGDRVEVVSVVGPNGDPHSYEPTPQDVCRFAEADIVFINGLHLDSWVRKLLASSNRQSSVYTVTAGINPRLVQEESGIVCDPHAWHDPMNAVIYVQNITNILVQKDPDSAEFYKKRARDYIARLYDLYNRIKDMFDSLPSYARIVMTAHEGFGYFGRAFGLEFHAPMGMSTEEEARPKDLARLIKMIGKMGMKILFAESISNDKVIVQVANETGISLGVPLYSDSLSEPSGPAASYEAMLMHNATHIKNATSQILMPVCS